MGWSLLRSHKQSPLIKSTDQTHWVYFVHSYAAVPQNTNDLAASTTFGKGKITAIIWNGRVGACQFHPEKSSYTGQLMIKRWVQWI